MTDYSRWPNKDLVFKFKVMKDQIFKVGGEIIEADKQSQNYKDLCDYYDRLKRNYAEVIEVMGSRDMFAGESLDLRPEFRDLA